MVELLKYMGVENPQGDISLTAVVVWLLVCIVAIGIITNSNISYICY